MKIVTYLLFFIIPCSFIAQTHLPISNYAFDERYLEKNFTSQEIKNLIGLSKSFSGLPKVELMHKNTTQPPYYTYSSTEKWPAGSWGRGYENGFDKDGGTTISSADNIRFYNWLFYNINFQLDLSR